MAPNKPPVACLIPQINSSIFYIPRPSPILSQATISCLPLPFWRASRGSQFLVRYTSPEKSCTGVCPGPRVTVTLEGETGSHKDNKTGHLGTERL